MRHVSPPFGDFKHGLSLGQNMIIYIEAYNKKDGAVALRKNFRNATAIFRIQAVHFFLFSFSEEKRKRKKELFCVS